MTFINQLQCFNINMIFWKILGIWPSSDTGFYNYYSRIFVTTFVIFYDLLLSINFYFLPRQMDSFIEEMIFYFTELTVSSKVLTFLFMHDKIEKIIQILESDIFQPTTKIGINIINAAMRFNVRYWKIVAAISVTSSLTHILSPFILHLIFPIQLELPVCSYSFLSDELKEAFVYPLYLYQAFGMHAHMWYNVNIDTFFLGLIIFTIAQLDILDEKLRTITDVVSEGKEILGSSKNYFDNVKDSELVFKLKKCIQHFSEVDKFCSMIQQVFSATLFIQFSMASCIICVCLFRFTLPAPAPYYIFLATYMFIMIIQIMVPCWFGTRVMDKSTQLAMAIYNCDWIATSPRFKSSLRVFVERTNRPLSITGGKMFPLSLATFSSIMNSAYSFFTLLRHMQTRQ